MNSSRKIELEQFCSENHFKVSDLSLLNLALTHKSFANEQSRKIDHGIHNRHNQRLEFLGDAILGAVVAEHVYQQFETEDEGDLTRKKAQLVCEASLVAVGNRIQLGSVLLLGRGELSTGGSTRDSNIADAMESVVGAIFLSDGFEAAKKLILNLWEPLLEELGESTGSFYDYKSFLQEYLMRTIRQRPEYDVTGSTGPEHEKTYMVSLSVNERVVSEGSGKNRKAAEQDAAKNYVLEHNIPLH